MIAAGVCVAPISLHGELAADSAAGHMSRIKLMAHGNKSIGYL